MLCDVISFIRTVFLPFCTNVIEKWGFFWSNVITRILFSDKTSHVSAWIVCRNVSCSEFYSQFSFVSQITNVLLTFKHKFLKSYVVSHILLTDSTTSCVVWNYTGKKKSLKGLNSNDLTTKMKLPLCYFMAGSPTFAFFFIPSHLPARYIVLENNR